MSGRHPWPPPSHFIDLVLLRHRKIVARKYLPKPMCKDGSMFWEDVTFHALSKDFDDVAFDVGGKLFYPTYVELEYGGIIHEDRPAIPAGAEVTISRLCLTIK
jgi:hypothetical protein